MSWMNFNDAEQQSSTDDIIPNKTLAKVILKVRPGGHDDATKGWTGGYATRSESTGSVYLDCEFTVIGGKYNKRKVWSLIGLESPKGPKWGEMGRSMIRAILESARGIKPDDASEAAMNARRIGGIGDLNGLEFVVQIDVEKAPEGSGYSDKNKINNIIPCTHKDYSALMNGSAPAEVSQAAQAASQPKAGVPAWAT